MKRVLFVYPHNFLELNMGTNIRVYALAKELHAMGCKIDLFALKNLMSRYDKFDEMNKKEKLIDRLYLYDYKEIKAWKKRKRALRKCYKFLVREELDNWVTPQVQQQFNQLVAETDYSHVVMFYTYTAELFSPKHFIEKEGMQRIYFMEDLLSVGEFIQKRSRIVGELLDCELRRLAYFDKIVCISFDEKIFIEKLLPQQKQFYFLPHIAECKNVALEHEAERKSLRITFVGYDNPYNIEGVNWFLEQVYPLLDGNVEITIVGKVNRYVTCQYANVTQIEYAEDIDRVYRNTDVIICPLLNGTGMKIKVVEGMSYSIPIVCTSRGVDGFPDKMYNGCLVADTAEGFAAHLNHLAQNTEFYQQCRRHIADYFNQMLCWNRHKVKLGCIFK